MDYNSQVKLCRGTSHSRKYKFLSCSADTTRYITLRSQEAVVATEETTKSTRWVNALQTLCHIEAGFNRTRSLPELSSLIALLPSGSASKNGRVELRRGDPKTPMWGQERDPKTIVRVQKNPTGIPVMTL